MNGHGYQTPSYGIIKNKISEVQKRTASSFPRIVTLIGGQDDETPIPHGTLSTAEADTANFKVGDRGWKLGAKGSSGYQIDFVPPTVPLVVPSASALCAWIYMEDVTKIAAIGFKIFLDSGLTVFSSFSSTTAGGLINGWNLLRWSTLASTTALDFDSIYRFQFTGGSTDASTFTVGHVWFECPEKAQILFIQDGGTTGFYNSGGYSDLNARGIPVTMGLVPNRVGTAGYITETQIAQLLESGNSVNFHSWDIGVTNTMTAAQIREDTMKCLKWIERKGYNRPLWRCAWTQNLAPQHAAVQGLLLAYGFATGGAAVLECYPFINQYNITRCGLHGYTEAGIDALFAKLKTTNSLMVCYTHDIGEGDVNNITPAMWEKFLSKIDTGLAEGWLEGVTMEQLMARSGFKIKQGLGDTVVEYYNKLGVLTTIRLP